MFESFYKLNPSPFRLTPDPHFFFESETHKRGLAYLRFAFYQKEGFVVVTGAPGTGKTELTLNLIEELPQQKVSLATIVTTNLDAENLIDLIATSFQIDIDRLNKGSVLKKLESFFISQVRTGKQVLLIIDEAHNLSVESLLELSMLENFQLNGKPLVQCFLLGQLSLEEKLNLPELEPLKQRVIASSRLASLDQRETREYIIHRLSKSGWNNDPAIHDDAFVLIHKFTKGIPRKINSLCDRLLLNSYVENRHHLDATTVNAVIQEIQQESVGEMLDFDFAVMRTIGESSIDTLLNVESQPVQSAEYESQEPVFSRETIAQKPATKSHNKLSHNNPGKRNYNDTDIVIDIPEFLKKTPDENITYNLKALDKIQKSDTRNPQREETGSIRQERYQVQQNADPSRSNARVATGGHTTQLHVSRSSGLLDKELKFLASLAASTALAEAVTVPAPEQTPELEPESLAETKKITRPTVEKNPELHTAPARKVIIDDSVYDDEASASSTNRNVIIDESVYDDYNRVEMNFENDWISPESRIPKVKSWQISALAAIVIASLVFSLNGIFGDKQAPDNSVSDNQSKISDTSQNRVEPVIASTTTPVDIDLPIVSGMDTKPESVNNTGKESPSISSTSDTSRSASPTATSVLAARTITETNSTPPAKESISDKEATTVADSSADNDLVQASRPDRKLTQKPEHLRPTPAESGRKANKGAGTTVTEGAAPASRLIDAKSAAVHNTNQDLDLATSAIRKSAENTSTVVASVATTSARSSDTTGTSVALANSRTNSITPRSDSSITQTDLKTLLSTLSAAYQAGDLQQLVKTFSPDINSSDGSNRQVMMEDYRRLFNITDKRQLAIQNVKWSTNDRQMLGVGNFEALVREKGATKYTTYQGKISFAVVKELGEVVIKKLDYDYD